LALSAAFPSWAPRGLASLVSQILHANTAQEVSDLALAAGLVGFHELLCREAGYFATSLSQEAYTLEVLLLGKEGEVLGRYPSQLHHNCERRYLSEAPDNT
jgi:hypothetical protein